MCDKTEHMRIFSHRKLVLFYTQHTVVKSALEEWYTKVRDAEWRCFADMKKSFNSVDSIGNQRYAFNIRGNNYRLVVVIKFTVRFVYIRFVGTHAEYEKIDCKTI